MTAILAASDGRIAVPPELAVGVLVLGIVLGLLLSRR